MGLPEDCFDDPLSSTRPVPAGPAPRYLPPLHKHVMYLLALALPLTPLLPPIPPFLIFQNFTVNGHSRVFQKVGVV